jgi:toxin FitB
MVLWGNLVGQLEQNGRPLPAMDSLIAAMPSASAAIAIHNSLSLVTRNEKDFAGTGVVIINPWAF